MLLQLQSADPATLPNAPGVFMVAHAVLVCSATMFVGHGPARAGFVDRSPHCRAPGLLLGYVQHIQEHSALP